MVKKKIKTVILSFRIITLKAVNKILYLFLHKISSIPFPVITNKEKKKNIQNYNIFFKLNYYSYFKSLITL